MLQSSQISLIESFASFTILSKVSDEYIRPLKFDCLGYPTIIRVISDDSEVPELKGLRKLSFSVSRRDVHYVMCVTSFVT